MPSSRAGSSKWGGFIAIALGVLMGTLDVSILNVTLPTMAKAFNTDFGTIQWVSLSYVLMVTAMMMGIARLGDMFGKRSIYRGGLLLFTTASAMCGFAPNVYWLIAGRALQGLGASMTQAMGTAILTETFPPQERGRAFGLIGSTVSVGLAAGPPIGGILVGLFGWPSVFFVNLPIGAIALFAVWRWVPHSTPARRGQRFDGVGALVLTIGLVCYALGLTMGQNQGFTQHRVLYLLAAGLVGLMTFVVVERRVREPMIDPHLFRNLLFTLNLVMGFLVFAVLAGNFILPFVLQLVLHLSIQHVGLLMMVVPVVMGMFAPISGILSDKYGPRLISLAGLIVIIGACLAMTTIHADVTIWGLVLRLAPMGMGMGLFQSPNNSAIMGGVPKERLGVASGLLALTRNLGTTTGLPMMGSLFTFLVLSQAHLPAGTDVTRAAPEALVTGYAHMYLTTAGVITLATVLAAVALIRSRRQDGDLTPLSEPSA